MIAGCVSNECHSEDKPCCRCLVLFSNVTQLDLTGLVQVLSGLQDASVVLVAGSLDPVMTDAGFSINPTCF